MAYGVRLHVWGERACFTRPEMKVERVSYDVMTPSAARGILEAVHWKPAIAFVVDRIHVLKPIRFQSFRRNEVGAKISSTTAERAMRAGSTAGLGLCSGRQSPATCRDPAGRCRLYHRSAFRADSARRLRRHPGKHISMFNRRAASGQCFHRPCLGTREFPADFTLIAEGAPLPECELPPDQRDRDLGWMLHDIDFANDNTSRFFRARLVDGVLDLQRCLADGVAT